jgi:hypothetical protein
MKLFAIFAACLLLAGIAAGSIMDDPDTLKISMYDRFGNLMVMSATQNESTGQWTVAMVDDTNPTVRMFFSNETGYVRIN